MISQPHSLAFALATRGPPGGSHFLSFSLPARHRGHTLCKSSYIYFRLLTDTNSPLDNTQHLNHELTQTWPLGFSILIFLVDHIPSPAPYQESHKLDIDDSRYTAKELQPQTTNAIPPEASPAKARGETREFQTDEGYGGNGQSIHAYQRTKRRAAAANYVGKSRDRRRKLVSKTPEASGILRKASVRAPSISIPTCKARGYQWLLRSEPHNWDEGGLDAVIQDKCVVIASSESPRRRAMHE
jgi:hypothetical protein